MQRPDDSYFDRQRTVTLKNSKLRNTFNLIDARSHPVPSKKRGASSSSGDNEKQDKQGHKFVADQSNRSSGHEITTPGAVGDQKAMQCHKCGRSFAPNRLASHQRVCLADVTPHQSQSMPTRSLDQTYQVEKTGKAGVRESRQPKFVFCYICGRQFTDASLPIHEPQCLQKWEVQNDKLPRSERRPRPKKPEILTEGGASGMTREELQEAQWQAAKANMVACRSCGRRFATDRIGTHERICKDLKHRPAPLLGATVQLSEDSTTANNATARGIPTDNNGNTTLGPREKVRESRQPKFVFCYICGRQFTDASLPIHEPQCLQKWEVQNDKLPRSERRPRPKKPEILTEGGGASGLSREQLQEAQWQAAKANLVECANCGRRFAPDRIHIHKRICKASPKDSTLNDNKAVLPGIRSSDKSIHKELATNTRLVPRTVVCYLCGREFGSKSIAIHQPQCLQKWHIENNKLPAHQRRPEPTKPSILPISGGGSYDLTAVNEAALQTALDSRVACANCGRKFNPDRVAIHERSCRPKVV